jgi:hypothetical protein
MSRINVNVIDTRTGDIVLIGSFDTLEQALEYRSRRYDAVPGDEGFYRAFDSDRPRAEVAS